MTERVVALCRELGCAQEQEALLGGAAQSACQRLRARLRPGVSEADCGEVFPLAAALLALETLEEVTGESRVTSFTAGEVSIRTEGKAALGRQAFGLLSPWLTDPGFGVKGAAG